MQSRVSFFVRILDARMTPLLTSLALVVITTVCGISGTQAGAAVVKTSSKTYQSSFSSSSRVSSSHSSHAGSASAMIGSMLSSAGLGSAGLGSAGLGSGMGSHNVGSIGFGSAAGSMNLMQGAGSISGGMPNQGSHIMNDLNDFHNQMNQHFNKMTNNVNMNSHNLNSNFGGNDLNLAGNGIGHQNNGFNMLNKISGISAAGTLNLNSMGQNFGSHGSNSIFSGVGSNNLALDSNNLGSNIIMHAIGANSGSGRFGMGQSDNSATSSQRKQSSHFSEHSSSHVVIDSNGEHKAYGHTAHRSRSSGSEDRSESSSDPKFAALLARMCVGGRLAGIEDCVKYQCSAYGGQGEILDMQCPGSGQCHSMGQRWTEPDGTTCHCVSSGPLGRSHTCAKSSADSGSNSWEH